MRNNALFNNKQMEPSLVFAKKGLNSGERVSFVSFVIDGSWDVASGMGAAAWVKMWEVSVGNRRSASSPIVSSFFGCHGGNQGRDFASAVGY